MFENIGRLGILPGDQCFLGQYLPKEWIREDLFKMTKDYYPHQILEWAQFIRTK